jgi:hypothetical protein
VEELKKDQPEPQKNKNVASASQPKEQPATKGNGQKEDPSRHAPDESTAKKLKVQIMSTRKCPKLPTQIQR